jgi:Fe-S-cluster containining protein
MKKQNKVRSNTAGASSALTTIKTSTSLPPLYSAWMDEVLGGQIPDERFSRCIPCAKCAPDGSLPTTGSNAFHPDVKCCSYYPDLPNFLVGGILGDRTARARQVVQARVDAGFSIDPLGVHSIPVYDVLYGAGNGTFGRCEILRCPYFIVDTGMCGIYRNRSSICATWYCKFVRGSVGSTFWAGVHDLLGEVEHLLARWCALELGMTEENLKEARSGGMIDSPGMFDLDGRIDPVIYRAMWGAWMGKEARYFKECAQLVHGLSWSQILALGGFDLQSQVLRVQKQYEKLTHPILPDQLKLKGFFVDECKPTSSVLVTFSTYDPVEVPQPVMEVLHYFDGRPVAEVLGSIKEAKQIILDTSLLQTLVDFEVLEAADDPGDSRGVM